MEESAYLTSIAAGAFYLVASYRLLRLSRRTGERPELLLGLYFAFSGQWYVFYNAPYFLGLESLPPLIELGFEWLYVIGVVPYLLFIRMTFRPTSAWATAIVTACAICLLVGAVGSSLAGGFSNAASDPAYLIEWLGYTVPCVWLCGESALTHLAARKRAQIGLCEPIVANRYLLFAAFGLFQVGACAADIGWASGNDAGMAASSISFALLGVTELASVAVLWLAFFPPRFYSAWIARRTALQPDG